MDDIPIHLRPISKIILPPKRENAECEILGDPETPVKAFRIPSGIRRVIVLSNVVQGFPWHKITPLKGDLVVHINTARHRDEAMLFPGTRHWLFVRHGKGQDVRGWHWYTPKLMDGFEKVFFVDDSLLVRPYKWFKDFREITQKSPTTGFIVANIFRELNPSTQLILVGFEPARDHGTSRWIGHDWQAEQEWYEARGFKRVPPEEWRYEGVVPPTQRLIILANSCRYYQQRTRRFADAKQCIRKRQTCRDTWVRALQPTQQFAFFVGEAEGATIEESDVWQLAAPDSYRQLPQKLLSAFKMALTNEEWDYLFKIDDDTFLRPERINNLIADHPAAVAHCPFRNRPLSGGAGFILRRDLVAALVKHAPLWPLAGKDDHVVHFLLRILGVKVKVTNLLAYDSRYGVPLPSNDQISVAQTTPEIMNDLYAQNYLRDTSADSPRTSR